LLRNKKKLALLLLKKDKRKQKKEECGTHARYLGLLVLYFEAETEERVQNLDSALPVLCFERNIKSVSSK
jgi:hypothetical protein